MMRPGPGMMRVIRVFFALMMAVSSVLAVRRFYPGRPKPAAVADTLAAADDRDGDGRLDPLPVRRLAASAAGETVLAAIDASGGWPAWETHTTARYEIEGVFFDVRGLIRGRGTELHTLRLNGPARIRIDPTEGRTRFGYGEAGAWVAVRLTDGRWSRNVDPDTWAPRRLYDLTWRLWWLFGLPFRLTDAGVRLTPAEPDSYDVAPAPDESGIRYTPDVSADTLAWVLAACPPTAGDSLETTYRLGFERSTGRLREVGFSGTPGSAAAGRLILHLDGFVADGGVTLPLQRTLYEIAAPGAPRRRIFTAVLDTVTWDAPAADSLFEPPPRLD